jgi:hypothetical protein
LIKRGFIEDVRGVFMLTLSGWDIADAILLAREKAPEIVANEEDLERHRRQMEANRRYDELLFSMGRRRPTITQLLDQAPLPPRVRPRIRMPLKETKP